MAVRGIKDVWESEYNYWRFKASITQEVKFRDYMTLDLKLAGSKTVGNVPLFLMHNGRGTRVNWMFDVGNTFQTMTSGSFYSTEQIAFFTRLKFKEIHINANWTEPRFGLHHALGYGEFDNRNAHVLPFETMEDGYYEAGLFVDNLIILKLHNFNFYIVFVYKPVKQL